MINLDIKIIKAINSDATNLVLVEKETWISTYVNNSLGITIGDITNRFNNFDERVAYVIESLKDPNHQYFLVKYNDKLIGYLHLMKSKPYNDLVEIYLLKEFHGMGIGSELMSIAFDWLGKEKSIILEVATYNDKAISVYKRYGFVEDSKLSQAEDEDWNILPSGKRIPVIFMIKKF